MTKVTRPSKDLRKVMSPEKRYAVIPRIKLPFNSVLTSAHLINTDESKLVVSNKAMSDKQVVVAAGPNAIAKEGDWICINVDMFPKDRKPGGHDVGTVTTVIPPLERIGDTDYLLITDRHIKYFLEK